MWILSAFLLLLVVDYCLSLSNFSWEALIDVEEGGIYSDGYLHDIYHSGLRRVAANALTMECRNLIEFEQMKYIKAMLEESPFPFEDIMFHSQCSDSEVTVPPLYPLYSKEPPKPLPIPPFPPKFNGTLHANNLSLVYVMLVHDHPEFAKRIIDAIIEPQHRVVIHVDLKAPLVHQELTDYFSDEAFPNVHVLQDERVDMIWGGFSLVNASINAMKYIWFSNFSYDYLALISGTTYPLKSKEEIRQTLSASPGSIYMDVHNEINRPPADMWHHYVECDGRLHRIARLANVRGINMHVGSQWFIIPKHLVDWYITNHLPFEYMFYAQHIVVADENYFQTLAQNSPYCKDIAHKNYLFLLFDKWENERNADPLQRDARKCLHPDPDQCGRSPTTLTLAYKNLLKISRALFARKFDPKNPNSMAMVDMIDRWRLSSNATKPVGDEGVDIMIRHRSSNVSALLSNSTDKCIEMSGVGDLIRFVDCDPSSPRQWFMLGPCTEGANVTLVDGGGSVPVKDSDEMFCQIQSSSRSICLDVSGENPHSGAQLIGWECSGQWNQMFHIGSNGSITIVQPDLVGQVRGFENVNITKCLEVSNDILITNDCASPSLVLNITSMATTDAVSLVLDVRKKIAAQQFQFLKKDSSGYHEYLSSKSSKSLPTNVPTVVKRLNNADNVPTAILKLMEESETGGAEDNNLEIVDKNDEL